MSDNIKQYREGSLDTPTRHPIDWKSIDYSDQASLDAELERIYDICHGCRRCVNLCNAFPTLFDLIDESNTMAVDGVAKADYAKVVDQCYLCDLCYLTKCPYVPPHEWNVDFPHLMLRAKVNDYKKGKRNLRDKVLASTDAVGSFAGIPVVAQIVNATNKNHVARKMIEKAMHIDAHATLPEFHSFNLRKRFAKRDKKQIDIEETTHTQGKVVLFITCYGNKNDPQLCEDLITVFEHNNIAVCLTGKEHCCGMPRLELGDLDAVEQAKENNVPELLRFINAGYDIIAPIPSCVLMFKQELPLMFPDDVDLKRIQDSIFDPFEYLMLRHKAGKLNTNFEHALGKVVYHVACHQRVQKIGMKTKEIMQLIPETTLQVLDRCSGHDGTYAVKSEFHEISKKICRPIINKMENMEVDHYFSDCPMAGEQIENGLHRKMQHENPFFLLKLAYGIT